MEDIILQELQTKFAGVAESILSRIAAKLAKTAKTEDEAKNAVAEFTLQMLLETNGDFRANDASVTAVKNYEKKHGLKDGQKLTIQKTEGEGHQDEDENKEEVPSWAKDLMTELKALKNEKVQTTRRAAIDSITKGLPDAVKKAYSRIDVTSLSDEDFIALQEEIKGEVADISREAKGKTTVFGIPKAGPSDGKPTDADADAIVDKMKI